MDHYDINITLKGLHISAKLQSKLLKIEEKMKSTQMIDGSSAQDGSQMYESLTLRQDMKIIVHSNDFIRIYVHRLEMENLRQIEKILGYPCNQIYRGENDNLDLTFHMRNDQK